MTSNIGADQLLAAGMSGVSVEQVRDPLLATVSRHFRPEFLNRLDEIISFRGLDTEQLRRITALLLEDTRERLREQNITLEVTEEALSWLASSRYVPEYGARPLRRTIAREVDRRLSHALLSNELCGGQHVVVGIEDDVPVLTITERG
jgi:ATP-dependent Clp protease ATP-binding subunit ClpC